jgi:hypothetical protein
VSGLLMNRLQNAAKIASEKKGVIETLPDLQKIAGRKVPPNARAKARPKCELHLSPQARTASQNTELTRVSQGYRWAFTTRRLSKSEIGFGFAPRSTALQESLIDSRQAYESWLLCVPSS